MGNTLKIALAGVLVLGLLACEARTDRTDGGGVLLTFGDIDWTSGYSMSAAVVSGVQIETLNLLSVAKQPGGATSSLMDVELQSFEVTFKRADTGTRVPPTLVRNFTALIPVNGTLTINNLSFMFASQLLNPPLSDLLPENGGFDKETGSATIVLDVAIVFFGRTLSGDEVQSPPLRNTLQFTR